MMPAVKRTARQAASGVKALAKPCVQQLPGATDAEALQKTTDQVRVNVHLINATTDAHLWADTYDRKLTDIFSVESEIAKTIAEMMRAKLTGSAEHVLASRPTENPEPHQLYLKGRYFWNKRTAANLQKAIAYFQQAIDKDPGYALAYAGLADANALTPDYTRTPAKDDISRAMAAARKAVELDDSARGSTYIPRKRPPGRFAVWCSGR